MSVRFRIHKNGSATLAGVDYQDLRSVLDGAAIHYYDDLRTERHPESIDFIKHQIKVLQLAKDAVDQAIAATFPPKPALTPAQRRKKIRMEREERILIDSIVNKIDKAVLVAEILES